MASEQSVKKWREKDVLDCLIFVAVPLSFWSHNWDYCSSGFYFQPENHNNKKPGVIIKYCCSMRIWWMIIFFCVTRILFILKMQSFTFLRIYFKPSFFDVEQTGKIPRLLSSRFSPSITKECRVITTGYYHQEPKRGTNKGNSIGKMPEKSLQGAGGEKIFCQRSFWFWGITTWKWLPIIRLYHKGKNNYN